MQLVVYGILKICASADFRLEEGYYCTISSTGVLRFVLVQILDLRKDTVVLLAALDYFTPLSSDQALEDFVKNKYCGFIFL